MGHIVMEMLSIGLVVLGVFVLLEWYVVYKGYK